jgi:hypothetical protein
LRTLCRVREGFVQEEERSKALPTRQMQAESEWLWLWRQRDLSQRWLRHNLR